jgi:hypothetical protein
MVPTTHFILFSCNNSIKDLFLRSFRRYQLGVYINTDPTSLLCISLKFSCTPSDVLIFKVRTPEHVTQL